MKVFKYSIMVLVLTIATNVVLAHADINLSPNQYGISGQTKLYYNLWSDPTEGAVKTDESTQSFYVFNAFTSYTNPCPDCQIKAYLQRRVNNKWGDVIPTITTKGNTGYFSGNTAEAAGTYRIKLKRHDITAAWTYVTWDWYVKAKN